MSNAPTTRIFAHNKVAHPDISLQVQIYLHAHIFPYEYAHKIRRCEYPTSVLSDCESAQPSNKQSQRIPIVPFNMLFAAFLNNINKCKWQMLIEINFFQANKNNKTLR